MGVKRGNCKRTFKDLRIAILICLSSGQHTINEISFKTKINWKTVELHLTYLVGRRLAIEVVKSKYVRIFELAEDGKMYVRSLGIEPNEENKKEEIRL